MFGYPTISNWETLFISGKKLNDIIQMIKIETELFHLVRMSQCSFTGWENANNIVYLGKKKWNTIVKFGKQRKNDYHVPFDFAGQLGAGGQRLCRTAVPPLSGSPLLDRSRHRNFLSRSFRRLTAEPRRLDAARRFMNDGSANPSERERERESPNNARALAL